MEISVLDRQFINIETLTGKSLENFNIIDVRSPIEYNVDHIPTAINVPILDDMERHITGIIYKTLGSHAAKYKALELIAPKIPEIITNIKKITNNGKQLVIYCARGGDRSRVVQTLLQLMDIKSIRLFSGYKAYRRYILDFFEKKTFPRCITLYGPTGCGKTEIIQMLSKEGFPTLNLEEYAAHKGSSFGWIGEISFDTINQKKFETSIWFNMYKNLANNYMFVEGESRKIGKVVIPDRLFYSFNKGIKIYMEMPLENRIKYIIDIYKPQKYKSELFESIDRIEKYMGKEKNKLLKALLLKENYFEFCNVILKDYYDPLYKKTYPLVFDYKIYYRDLYDAKNKLKEIFCEARQ